MAARDVFVMRAFAASSWKGRQRQVVGADSSAGGIAAPQQLRLRPVCRTRNSPNLGFGLETNYGFEGTPANI
jgi:hypothetical protein